MPNNHDNKPCVCDIFYLHIIIKSTVCYLQCSPRVRGDQNTEKKVSCAIIFPTYAENHCVGYYFSPAFFNKYSFEPRDPFENRTY